MGQGELSSAFQALVVTPEILTQAVALGGFLCAEEGKPGLVRQKWSEWEAAAVEEIPCRFGLCL